MRKLILIAAALCLIPTVSQAKTLEELLVEKGVVSKADVKGVTTSGAKVYWNNGTRFEFPDSGFTSSIATYLVERYTFGDADETAGGKNTSSFDQKKARLIISGSALDNEFNYYLQSDFVGETVNGKNTPSLKDAYVQWNACDFFSAKMGQYKTFFSRQYATADQFGLLPDTAIATQYFNLDRQQGLSGTWKTEDKTVEFKAGIFNGNSSNEGTNMGGKDTKHTGIVAVRYNPVGQMNPYEESDVSYTQDLALSFGSSYAYGKANWLDADGAISDKVRLQGLTVDGNMKYQGVSLNAEFFYANVDSMNPSTASYSPVGFYLQGGYFLTPKKLELAGRFSMVDCDNGKAAGTCSGLDRIEESTVAFNYYFWKHYLKASLAYSAIQKKEMVGSDNTASRWIFQLSSFF